jgi:hypothetical protein
MPEEASKSLLSRARRLQALGRAERENRDEKQDHQRMSLSLQRLEDAISGLEATLKTYKALRSLNIPVSSLPDLHKAPAEIREYVNTIARPTADRLTGSVTRVNRATERIRADLDDNWTSWASEQILALPIHKIPQLPPVLRREVEARLTVLKSDSRGSASAGSARQFKLGLDVVREELNHVIEHSILETALRKIMGTPPVTLAGLSDEELEAVRSDESVAKQIVLSRR